MSAVESLDALWASGGDHSALVDGANGVVLAYDDVAVVVDRLARQLVGAGIQPGDVVAFSLPNGPEIVTTFLAVTAARAVAAPLNPAYSKAEFASYLEDLAAVAMVFLGDHPNEARQACAERSVRVLELECRDGRSELRGVAPHPERADPEPDDVALLLHTSGTTSRPKSVPIRHRNLVASARNIAAGYGLTPEDVSHCVMPLFHVHGIVASVLAPLAGGGRVIVGDRFNARVFWKTAERLGTTWFSAVPTMLHVLADRAPGTPPAAIRFARSCSSALPPTLMERFEERFRVPLVEAYGMTEATHQMTSNPLPPGERLSGSVGVPAGAEVAIVDDDWQPLPQGKAGNVVVRGPGVVDGYRDNPQATRESFRDGWFSTGDAGRLSEQGYLRLTGRVKELINRAGEKVSPYEVEHVLMRHPDVVEAVAFPLPHEKYGEVVGALLVGDVADVRAVRSYCADHLAPFKVPARIFVVDDIPKGPTGKVQRVHLTRRYS